MKVLDRVFELGCRFWDTAGKFSACFCRSLMEERRIDWFANVAGLWIDRGIC